MKKDIADRKGIELLVNTFYEKVKSDPLISRFFTETIKLNWDKHLPVMYQFWDNALFYSGEYNGQPLEVHKHIHALSPLSSTHFERWVKLFTETVDELFEGEKATLAKTKAINISTIMQLKILKNGESPLPR